MRKLCTKDVFSVARIIKHCNAKEELAKVAELAAEKKLSAEKAGIDVFMTIVEAAADKEQEKRIYELLADIAEKSADDIQNQSLEATLKDLKQIVAENNIAVFFKNASRLTIS